MFPLIIYVYATVYMRWMADDWCIIDNFRQYGNLGGLRFYYTTWSGRFANYLTTGLVEPTGLTSVIVLTAGLLIVWWIALFGIIRIIAQARKIASPFALSAIVSSLVIVGMLNAALNPIQSVYWFGGSTGYFIPLVLLTFYIWLVARHIAYSQTKRIRTFSLIGAGVLLFFVSGYMEDLGLIQAVCLGLALLLMRRSRPLLLIRGLVLAGFIGTIAGLAINVLGPGNYVRLFVDIPKAAPQTLKFDPKVFAVGILGSPVTTAVFTAIRWPLAPIALIFIPAFIAYRFDPHKLGKWNVRRSLKWLLLIIYVQLVISMTGYMVITKGLPAGRLWFIPEYILFCGYVVGGYLFGLSFKNTIDNKENIWIGWLVAVLMFLVVLTSVNKVLDLVSGLKSYAEAWDNREGAIFANVSSPTPIAVDYILNIAGLDEVSDDPHFWPNSCIAQYHNVSAIVAGNP